jgi:hypothetical protein
MSGMKLCLQCKITKSFDEFHKRTRSKDGFHHYCKTCCNQYYQNNSETRKLYSKNYRLVNAHIISSKMKNYYTNNIDYHKELRHTYYLSNKVKVNSYNSLYRKDNKGVCNAATTHYRLVKKKSTPQWLSQVQLEDIKEFYNLAQDLAWLNQDGKAFHVDHIVPLRGKIVCGLHVPWNLQLLPGDLNFKKSNGFK